MSDSQNDEITPEEILEYHERAPAGKIFTGLAKSADTQRDLSIAYSPGVALPCRRIHEDEDLSFRYTGRGNLVGVITNGSAVLGLGNIGPYAAKPVMEGKAMLFKKYADIDVFDLELKADSADAFVDAVKALEPTLGGVNLEDIGAPACFYIEERLRAEMAIPVMHDDQHGTAIIASAALLNALEIAGKSIDQITVVFSGAGAAAIACAQILVSLGVKREHITMCDRHGVIHPDRDDLDEYKSRFARKTEERTLAEALEGSDVFIGVSVGGVLKPEMVKTMADNPIIFALANPDPEILPDAAKQARADAIIATGRSDFPNQVNNVLGFPFIFRGALDVQAREINEDMKRAAVHAIAELAKEDVPDAVMRAYQEEGVYQFGRDYLIPKPVDPRVLFRVAPAVAQAAMDSGVARRHVDTADYGRQIERVLGPTQKMISRLKRELHGSRTRSKRSPRVVIPHAYDRRIIKAASQVASEGDVRICLLGNDGRIRALAQELGLKNFDSVVETVSPVNDIRANEFAEQLFALRQRKGISRTQAFELMANHNYFAAMMVKTGHADGMLSGVVEPYASSARPILEVIGSEGGHVLAGIYMIMAQGKQYFFADCTINFEPDAETLADIAYTTALVAERYSSDPVRVAMLSFGSFGASKHPNARKVARAVEHLHQRAPHLEVDGEMQADVALNENLRCQEFPFTELAGDPNVLIFPDLASANISYKLLTNMSGAAPTGPILVGINRPANVLQRSATTEEIINMLYVTAHQTLG